MCEHSSVNGPVITRRIADMSEAERREIDRAIIRAYIKHGFYLAWEYDTRIAQGRPGMSERERQEVIREDIPYSSPHTGYNLKNILHRIELSGKPWFDVVVI